MNFSALLAQFKTFLARYTLQQKSGMVVAAGMVVGLLWAMVYFVNRVDYQVLYSDLDPQEAQGIVTKLQGLQVPYTLSDDGTTVRVAADRLSEVRLQLASEGLPESGRIGFEIFDRTNFGLTNFQEQVNFQRALEGELARSVMTLSEVAAARVHLVMSKESFYRTPEDQTKASVILKLKSGRTLSGASVQGIVNMVSNAVKGLSPERVTVIDYRGKLLSRSDAENSLTGQQLDLRQKMESEMAAKIVQLLEPTVGIDKVRPQVSITMNFQQIDETIEQYDPQASAIKTTNRQQENAPGATTTGGIVGPRPAAPTPAPNAAPPPAATPAPGAPAPVTAPIRENEFTNYEVSKSIRHIVNPVGRVERLSVAVLIDNQTTSSTTADGKTETKSAPRTPEEMKKYRDLVSAAIAFNEQRGDQLIVENLSFGMDTEPLEPTVLEKNIPHILTGVRYLIVPVVFLFIYVLFVRPVQKAAFAPVELLQAGTGKGLALPRAGGAQTPMTVRQLEARLDGAPAPALPAGPAAGSAEHELLPTPVVSKMDLIRKRIVEQAKQDPETIARLVRIWLNEERNNK